MSLSIQNRSEIVDGALVSVNSIVPFTIMAESSLNTRVICDVYHAFTHTDVDLESKAIIKGLELLKISQNGSQSYFRCDLSSILKSVFKITDDTLQNASEWIELPDFFEDFVIKFTASNGTDADVSIWCEFTAANMTTQFGEELIKGLYSEADATSSNIISTLDKKLNKDDIVLCQAGNVVYLHAILSDDGAMVSPDFEGVYYFIDSLDEVYLCDENFNFTKEDLDYGSV